MSRRNTLPEEYSWVRRQLECGLPHAVITPYFNDYDQELAFVVTDGEHHGVVRAVQSSWLTRATEPNGDMELQTETVEISATQLALFISTFGPSYD